jgi:hypothetical protein
MITTYPNSHNEQSELLGPRILIWRKAEFRKKSCTVLVNCSQPNRETPVFNYLAA